MATAHVVFEAVAKLSLTGPETALARTCLQQMTRVVRGADMTEIRSSEVSSFLVEEQIPLEVAARHGTLAGHQKVDLPLVV